MKHSKRWLLALILVACTLLCGCSSGKESAYNKGLKQFANAEYAEAAKTFSGLGDYLQAKTYAAYSQGLLLYEQERYAEAEPYFAQCPGFMYANARYLYCHASALQDAGSYAEAATGFLSMGDYENAFVRGKYCAGRAAEESGDYETALYAYGDAGTYEDAADRLFNIQGTAYNLAISMMEEGDYQKAGAYFTMLGDYLRSAEYAIQCKNLNREAQYAQAEEKEAAGDYQAAYTLFSGLTGYRDAAQRAENIAEAHGLNQE